jgi:3-hydroxyisobutyrate dehydrogenase-like beta-hydroxyacid dehydrogenase
MAGKAPLGFVGLGTMGGVMASRLVEAGHPLVVCDTNAAAVEALVAMGAVAAASPAAVASAAEIVFASLPTPDVVRSVATGTGGVIKGDTVRLLVDLSTTGPRVSGEVAEILAARNVTLVDAPVSGGRGGAIKGTLAVMAAAPLAAFNEVAPYLAVFGKVIHVGEKAGLAQTMKLVNNLMSVAALAITSEGMVMGVKAGLDPQVMLDVLNASSGRNSATVDKFPRAIIPRSFDFGFSTGLSMKDIRLCLQEADAMGVPLPVGSAVQQILSITNQVYGPQSDFTSICKLMESWAGVEVKSARAPDRDAAE